MTKMLRRSLLAFLVGFLILIPAGNSIAAQESSPVATPAATGLDGAAAWLISQQGEEGAFIGFTGEPDAGVTVDAILALAAARQAGLDTSAAIDRAISYLATGEVALVYVQTGPGQAAKMVLALHAAGEDPLNIAGVQPLTIVERGVDDDTDLYGTGVFDHALAVMALAATGTEIPPEALAAFEAYQADNGGWAFDGSTDPAMTDSNTTALAIQALVAAGAGDHEMVASGLAYLESLSTEDGTRYSDADWATPDANSTAFAIQALIAVETDFTAQADALTVFQNPGGAFYFNAEDTSDNVFATLQAIPALAQAAFPIASPAPQALAGRVAA